MSNLNSIVLSLAIGYALLGVLLLVACLFTPLPWPVKAGAIIVTSAFYLVSFFATHSLLGWSTDDPLPPNFKLLGARIVEPHSVEGDPGSIYLWIEACDDDNFPSGVPRAYRLPYSAKLADKTEAAVRASADGHPQGGRTANIGTGQGGIGPTQATPAAILATGGGDPAGGGDELDTSATHGQGLVFTPLLPPRMPAKTE
ncbi:MAG: hypothetical protein WA615_12765 [Bradyrhizobium sp.]|jgi:hypothetical protein|uniref:hypothetical protein n=1 Tax=Bradyrhizobium sp. TaxID=376 RepID=UPI003C7BDD52